MATTYTLAGTNTTASTATIAPIKLGLYTNYNEANSSNIPKQPGTYWMSNATTGTALDEYIMVKSQKIKAVKELKIPVRYPIPVKDGVRIEAKIQSILREVRDDGTIYDHPIVMCTWVATDVTAPFYDFTALQPSFVEQMNCRMQGVFHHDDGTERWLEYAKTAIEPKAD